MAAAPSWPPLAADLRAAATVVIVDDQEANISMLARLLELEGVGRVVSLTDPREVVARCLALEPDLLMLDLHMPQMSGYAVLDALRESLPPTAFLPILVLTGDLTAEARERALRAGAKDFVTKPFDRTEVVLRVTNLLETRALYARLEQDNVRLRRQLEAEQARERRIVAEHEAMAGRIRNVITDGQLYVVSQPIVDLQTGAIVGVEALARIAAEPMRPPNEWFAEAHRCGLGTELEMLAVRQALTQLGQLPAAMFIAVNLSPDVVLATDLEPVFAEFDGRRVILELTEDARIDDYPKLLTALDALRYQGVRVAIDDAGAGYAGLHRILQLLPDVLKMDLELIRAIDADPVRRALASSLVRFAGEIGAVIVAEGIETVDELSTLRALGTTWGQGYHLARPAPLPLRATTVDVDS